MVYWEQADWRRKHDGPPRDPAPIPRPQRIYYPQSRADLQQIVREAEAMPQPPEVRAAGSHWGLSEAAVTTGFAVETHAPGLPPTVTAPAPAPGSPLLGLHPLNRTLYEVVGEPGCLSAGTLDALLRAAQAEDSSRPEDTSSFYLYHVEAGTRIYELYCELDGGDTSNPRSLASHHPILAGAWALPTMGGAGGQTIVGAFTTGTHGSDVHRPPIADAVVALHLIGPNAREYWLEPLTPNDPFPLTDSNLLQSQYPGIEIIRDAGIFNAVLVSAGRMGIIYSVVLKVVRQFALHELREASTWSAVVPWITDQSHTNFTTNHFIQVAVNPHARIDNPAEHTCYITTHNPMPMRDLPVDGSPNPVFTDRIARCGANAGNSAPPGTSGFLSQICQAANAQEALRPLLQFLEGFIGWATAISTFIWVPGLSIYAHLVLGAAQAILIELHVLVDTFTGTLGELVAEVCNLAIEHNMPIVIQMMNEVLMSEGQPIVTAATDPPVNHISYAMMDGNDYLDRNCRTAADSIEVGFDATSSGVVTFMALLFRRLEELEAGTLTGTGQRLTFGGYASVRFTGRSTALLAMQQWPVTCIVEIAGLGGITGNDPFLRALEADALSLGATVHWGQKNNLTAAQVEATYGPRLETWRNALARFSRNGRLATFSTQFTRARGLEVVQPRIRQFAVQPRFACAGETVTATWDAEDNPAATQLTLITIPAAGSPARLELPSLHAPAQLVMPAGPATVRLEATVTYVAGRRQDQIERPVMGFAPGAPPYQPTIGPPTCQVIDGVARWVSEFELPAAEWSPHLRPGNMLLRAGSAPVLVRKSGVPDFLLQTRGVGVSFLGATNMAGHWQLISPRAGCGGSPPTLAIDISVQCG